jgi:hypothetical protein
MFVPDEYRKSVVFLGTVDGERFQPRATAFVISYEEYDIRFMYLVTAEHVISGHLTRGYVLHARINLTNGDVVQLEVPNDRWRFYPSERGASDVAICPITDHTVDDKGNHLVFGYEFTSVPLKGKNAIIADKKTITEKRIGVGDEVAVIGLFRSHFGRQRNVPIVRIGNIAMLEGEPVKTRYTGYIDAHLIEARSISGLSGSPVFVNLPLLRVVDGELSYLTRGSPYFFFFGLMHGHFDVENLNEDSVVEDGSTSGGINTGIGVVIPVEKLIKTVEQADAANERREAAEIIRGNKASQRGDVVSGSS